MGKVKEWDFAAWQMEFDQTFRRRCVGIGKRRIQNADDGPCQAVMRSAAESPFALFILIEHLHGAFNSMATTALRHCQFGVLLTARWEDASVDQLHIKWVRETFSAIDPLKTGTYSTMQ